MPAGIVRPAAAGSTKKTSGKRGPSNSSPLYLLGMPVQHFAWKVSLFRVGEPAVNSHAPADSDSDDDYSESDDEGVSGYKRGARLSDMHRG